MKTRQQRKNIQEALIWWPTIPSANVASELGYWRKDSVLEPVTCNTVACFGGWCAVQPLLVAQGLSASGVGSPKLENGISSPMGVSFDLFGDSYMFKVRGEHPADEGFVGTDHELVSNRLLYALAH